MPFPPPPMTHRCNHCGWETTTAPRSDALVIGIDHFRECPRCGSEDLRGTPAGPIARELARLKRRLGL